VTALVTVNITGDDSWMFQIPGTHLVEHQANLANVPWLQVDTVGIQEQEISDLEAALSSLKIDGIVSGALRSDYQKVRLERMAERLGIHSWTPLWHQSSIEHMRGLVSNGFEVMLTSVSCDGLDESWLGQILTEKSLAKLEQKAEQFRFNVDGEGGEYETLVVGGPHLPGRLDIEGQVVWKGNRGTFECSNVVPVIR
jgi:predicted ATP pyrophosphatase (TIGR00289 family)